MFFNLIIFFSFFHLIDNSYRNLPEEHLEYYFKNNFDDLKYFCKDQQVLHPNCTSSIDQFKCWGYEKDEKCKKKKFRYHYQPICFKKLKLHPNLIENEKIFYDEADFGYIKQRKNEIKNYCKPFTDQGSSLQCCDYLRFCEAKNIFIDFKNLNNIPEPIKYRGDVLNDGQIGGWNCKLDKKLLNSQNSHKSPLQSWYEEIEHYTVVDKKIKCDVYFNKTTYIMKLDASSNMYHHFCDFINLYATLHLTNDFNLDKQILIWDTYPYRSNFEIVWKSFTQNKVLNLNNYKNKKICFENAVFPLLPRMIFGLYYNMPLIDGCKKSGLFHAFNRHLLKNLNITVSETDKIQPIKITFLSRSTSYRKILNEKELIEIIKKNFKDVVVNKVDFNHKYPFINQIKITAKTDILIGMHGAGLTHCLFMPDWSVLFELYNCGDENCYKDLARLRGIKYLTWKNEKKLSYIENEQKNKPAHLKFTDYNFDKKEFIERLKVAINYVRKKKPLMNKKISLNSKTIEKNLQKIEL